MTNTIGDMFKVTSFGSSHGKALGAVVDGCPAGLPLSEKDIQIELNKRKPNQSEISTSRDEDDKVELLSGIFNNRTDGTPIAAIVYNKDHKSSSYENLKDKPRPGHGDYTWREKYGIYDYLGGGRGSGRVTLSNVIAGAIAKKLLAKHNIEVIAHVKEIADIKSKITYENLEELKNNINSNELRCADLESVQKMKNLILDSKEKGDSLGGIVEILVFGLPAGLGEPVFGKIDGEIAKILMNIGSVKGVEFGAGFEAGKMKGSENNDEFYYENNKIKTYTNNAGGVLGGMTTGMPLKIKIAVKPTPSISKKQKTVDLKNKKNCEIEIKGRHDPCICPRLVPVAESNVAIVIVDNMIKSGHMHPNNYSQ